MYVHTETQVSAQSSYLSGCPCCGACLSFALVLEQTTVAVLEREWLGADLHVRGLGVVIAAKGGQGKTQKKVKKQHKALSK